MTCPWASTLLLLLLSRSTSFVSFSKTIRSPDGFHPVPGGVQEASCLVRSAMSFPVRDAGCPRQTGQWLAR